MQGRLGPDLEARLSLYLDGELPAPERLEFERRIETDPDLREALEFHRGLTLEFHEEVPPLPRGYAARARARLESVVPPPAVRPWWRGPIGVSLAASAALAIVVMAIVGPGFWPRSISPARVASSAAPAAPDLDASRMKEQARADQETIDALRSLGYLSSGRPAATPGKISAAAAGKTKIAKVRAPAAASSTPKLPQALSGGAETAATAELPAEPAREMATAELKDAAAPEARPAGSPAAAAAPGPVPFRVVPLPAGPDLGSDRVVIRTADAWAAFVGAAARPAPVASFEAEMLVVLRDDLARDPPARLRVLAVTRSAEEIVVSCRVESRGAGGEAGAASEPGAASPGQAIVLPASDLPVRVVLTQEPG